jgi:hypothetical protein
LGYRDAGQSERTAFAEMAPGLRNKGAGRREDNRCVERAGRSLIGGASPDGLEFFCQLAMRNSAREDMHLTSLMMGQLEH